MRWDSFSLSRSSLSSLAAQPNSVRVNGSGQAEAWLLTAECFSSFVLMDNFLSSSRLSSSFKAIKRLRANLCFHLGRREGPFVSDLITTGRSVEKYGKMICFRLVFIDGRD